LQRDNLAPRKGAIWSHNNVAFLSTALQKCPKRFSLKEHEISFLTKGLVFSKYLRIMALYLLQITAHMLNAFDYLCMGAPYL